MTSPRVAAARSAWPLRTIWICGGISAALLFGYVLYGIAAEAPQLSSEGKAMWWRGAALRAGFGVLFALLNAAPYALLAAVVRRKGFATVLSITSVILFAVQLWLTVEILFFSRGSTAAIGLLFLPIYLCAAAAAVCLVIAVVSRLGPRSAAR